MYKYDLIIARETGLFVCPGYLEFALIIDVATLFLLPRQKK